MLWLVVIAGRSTYRLNLKHTRTHANTGKNQGLFNNAAQVFNHSFYWLCMKKGGGGAPQGPIADLIARDFGSYEAFKARRPVDGVVGGRPDTD